MARFRGPRAQAEHAIKGLTAIGEARHTSRSDGKIHSLGTARGYEQALTSFAAYLAETRQGDLSTATPEQAFQYLEYRASEVAQKTLDQDRQAIQAALSEKLPRIRSEVETILSTRAYTQMQVDAVARAQTDRNAISTQIAVRAGIRAHELLTLLPAVERPASPHRTWSDNRFDGREGDRYTVVGKGGLIREVLVPHDLAKQLEERRHDEPIMVTDRGIHYSQSYNIGGGQSWSQSFSAASERALGWSQGGHGCRHTYAQERVSELQERSYSFEEAKETVSQELGHFRADIIDAYLR